METALITPRSTAYSFPLQIVFWGLLVLALVAYCLVWVVMPSVSLSLGAYDLAEWSSLHPAVRGENPILLTSLLLRLPLACLGIMAAFAVPRLFALPHSWVIWSFHVLFTLVIAAALLPPFEYFAGQGSDVNYGQQFTLTLFTLVMGVVGLSGLLGRIQEFALAFFALIAAGAGLWGMFRTQELMYGFNLPVRIGPGSFALAVLCLGIVVFAFYSFKSKQGRT